MPNFKHRNNRLDPASERIKGLTEIDELTDLLESKKIARLVLQILRIRYRYEDDIIVAIATTNLSQQNQWLFVPLELDLHLKPLTIHWFPIIPAGTHARGSFLWVSSSFEPPTMSSLPLIPVLTARSASNRLYLGQENDWEGMERELSFHSWVRTWISTQTCVQLGLTASKKNRRHIWLSSICYSQSYLPQYYIWEAILEISWPRSRGYWLHLFL